MAAEPTTLQEAVLYFASPENCRDYLVTRRWPNGVICPHCGSANVLFQAKYNRWQCGSKHDRRQFTSKTGTIFEDSPLDLDKWLMTMWQVVNCKNGVSSYEVHRAIGVTQKTAWFMDHRIRFALGMTPRNKLSSQVEADETFIGGKGPNMHASKRARVITGTEGRDKTAVMGIVDRGGKVRTKVMDNTKKKTLQNEIRDHVLVGSALASRSEGLREEFSRLAKQWRNDTQHLSLISKKILHPAYLRIIGMGETVVPLLLEELRDRPAHWFVALQFTANACPSVIGSSPSDSRDAWLLWGRVRGLIP